MRPGIIRLIKKRNSNSKGVTTLKKLCTTLAELKSLYDEAVIRWKIENPASQKPAFWELDIDPDSLAFEKLGSEVAQRINSHSTRDADRLIVFLFCLLIARISRARGNKMWPDVTAEIESLSGAEIAPSRAATFFRDKLRKKFGAELESSVYHFKYVHLCFDQTGIGEDRASYIRLFFRQLMERIPPDECDESEFVESEFDRYIESYSDPGEIDPLRTVLLKTGTALVKLARAFQSGEAGELLLNWDWQALRTYWMERSGEDLGRLSPEAREVFEETFPSLRQYIRRKDLIAYVEHGSIVVFLPDGSELNRTTDTKTIPVGWAIAKNKAVEKEFLILDDKGNSPDSYEAYTENEWINIDGYYVYASSNTFTVIQDDVQFLYPYPVYAGNKLSNQKLIRYAWLQDESSFASLEVLESNKRIESDRTTDLYLNFKWLEGDQGLKLSIRHFSFGRSAFSGDVAIRVDDREIWQGHLTNGQPSEKLTKKVETDIPDAQKDSVCVELKSRESKETLASINLSYPLDAPAFFVIDGRVVSLSGINWIKKDYLTGQNRSNLKLVTRSGLAKPESNHVRLTRLEDSHFASHPNQYQLILTKDDSSDIQILLGESEFRFGIGEPVDIVTAGKENASFGKVSLATEGEVDLVDKALQWTVGLIGDLSGKDFSITVSTGKTDKRFDLPSLSEYIKDKPTGRSELAIGEAISKAAVDLETGPVSISVEGKYTTYKTINAFLIDRAEVIPGKFGDKSRLLLSWNETRPISTDSELAVSFLDDGTIARCSRRLSISQDAFVDLFWEPAVVDVFMSIAGSPTELKTLITPELLSQGVKIIPSNKDEPFFLCTPGQPEIKIAEKGLTLNSLPSLISQAEPTTYQILTRGGAIREICVDPTIKISFSKCNLGAAGDSLVFENLKLYACSPEILLSVACNDEAVSTNHEIPLIEKVGVYSFFDDRFELPVVSSLGGIDPESQVCLVAADALKEIYRINVEVHGLEAGLRPDIPKGDVQTRIKDIIRASRGAPDSFRLDNLVFIMDDELSSSNCFPVKPEGIIAGLSRSPLTRNNQYIGSCIQLLASIESGDEYVFEKFIPDEFSRMAVCVSTLQLVEEIRRFKSGTMSTEFIKNTLEYMNESTKKSEDEDVREWSNYVVAKFLKFNDTHRLLDISETNNYQKQSEGLMPDRHLLKMFDVKMNELGKEFLGE